MKKPTEETTETVTPLETETAEISAGTSPPAVQPVPVPKGILMVETENVVEKKFTTTEEMKAVTQELVKTIRELIQDNPLYR